MTPEENGNQATTPAPRKPEHKLSEQADYELNEYRHQLQRALEHRDVGSAPVAGELRRRLDEVLAEMDDRREVRRRYAS